MSIGDSKLQAMLSNVDKKAEKILDFENDDIIKNLQYMPRFGDCIFKRKSYL